jgi:hypothetical protein
MQNVVLGQDTLRSALALLAATFGLVTTDQLVPLQRSITVFVPLNVKFEPTAKHKDTDAQETPASSLCAEPVGTAAIDHAVPFQFSMS